ncbi:hypothetical protein DEO72_LG7g1133 [Vigna unguiculata]|uniref:Uncharacterized protein n=1 Tax=Vigna unguiculata TaxID=3917 RepID=A0A4D6MFQ4_VIGUN|nr:hypothetical protein DEO72_LG7g1133 [Vigna unguiculata]
MAPKERKVEEMIHTFRQKIAQAKDMAPKERKAPNVGSGVPSPHNILRSSGGSKTIL